MDNSSEKQAARPGPKSGARRWVGLSYLAVLLAVFYKPLLELVSYAANSEVHSHVLLIPFISAYLLRIRRPQLPLDFRSSPGWALAPLVGGGLAWLAEKSWHGLSVNDSLSWLTLSFVCFLVAGGFLFLGRKWMAAAAFPVAFLLFMVPLPDHVIDFLETASKLASAEAAAWFFSISGTPVLRDGVIFQLPGIAIEVAQECSGIRSSLVLFITSLVAAQLFLKSPWRRAILIAFVIPLGILRNGFRILVIGMLCANIGPHMIHHAIHKRGGPVFFALALIPLFLLLWWLRKGEHPRQPTADGSKPPAHATDA